MATPVTRADIQREFKRAKRLNDAYARSLGTNVRDAQGENSLLILAHWREVSKGLRQMYDKWDGE